MKNATKHVVLAITSVTLVTFGSIIIAEPLQSESDILTEELVIDGIGQIKYFEDNPDVQKPNHYRATISHRDAATEKARLIGDFNRTYVPSREVFDAHCEEARKAKACLDSEAGVVRVDTLYLHKSDKFVMEHTYPSDLAVEAESPAP